MEAVDSTPKSYAVLSTVTQDIQHSFEVIRRVRKRGRGRTVKRPGLTSVKNPDRSPLHSTAKKLLKKAVSTFSPAVTAAATNCSPHAEHHLAETPTTPASPILPARGELFTRRNELVTPAATPLTTRRPSDEEQNASESEGEGTAPRNDEAFNKAIIAAVVPVYAEYKKAKSVAAKKQVWKKVTDKLGEEGFQKVNDDEVRRKYQRFLSRYKSVKDHNNKTGRDRIGFRYEDAFDAAYSEITASVEISTTIDESGEPTTSGLSKRSRAKGSAKDHFEQRKLELLSQEVEMKMEYMKHMMSNDDKKLKLLEELVRSGDK